MNHLASAFILTVLLAQGCANTRYKELSDTSNFLEYSPCTNVEIDIPRRHSNWIAFYAIDDSSANRSKIERSGILLATKEEYENLAILCFFETHLILNGSKSGRSGFCIARNIETKIEILGEIESNKLYQIKKGKIVHILDFSSGRKSEQLEETIKKLDEIS